MHTTSILAAELARRSASNAAPGRADAADGSFGTLLSATDKASANNKVKGSSAARANALAAYIAEMNAAAAAAVAGMKPGEVRTAPRSRESKPASFIADAYAVRDAAVAGMQPGEVRSAPSSTVQPPKNPKQAGAGATNSSRRIKAWIAALTSTKTWPQSTHTWGGGVTWYKEMMALGATPQEIKVERMRQYQAACVHWLASNNFVKNPNYIADAYAGRDAAVAGMGPGEVKSG
jgi:hypothetical protein